MSAKATMLPAAMALGLLSCGQPREQPRVEAKQSREEFRVGAVTPLHGTEKISISIIAGGSGGYIGSVSGGSHGQERNVILLDTRDGTSRRILPDNSRRIEATWFLPAAATNPDETRVSHMDLSSGSAPPLAWFVIAVRHAEGPGIDVLAGRVTDGVARPLLRGVEGIDSLWMAAPDRLAMIVRQDRALSYRTADLANARILSSRPIAID